MDAKVLERVSEHAKFVDEQYAGRFFTALQGSQNYHLNDEFSDVDTKTLLLPSFCSLCFGDNGKRSSTTLLLPNGEHADVKDYRDMFLMFRKQNVNFVEILFSEYADVTPYYQWYYDSLVAHKEEIARYNPYQTIRAMVGHIKEKAAKFANSTVTTAPDVAKWGYDPKQLHHMIRLKDFLERYVSNEAYASILAYPNDRDYIIAVKRGLYPLEKATEIKNDILKWAQDFEEEWTKVFENKPDERTEAFLREITVDLMATKMKQELCGDCASVHSNCATCHKHCKG